MAEPTGAAAALRRPEGEEGDPVQVLYVAGIGRSGSTVLARALGSLDGFFAGGEVMHLFGRGIDRDERCACGETVASCRVWGRVAAAVAPEGAGLDPGAVDTFRHHLTEGGLLLAPFLPWRPRRLERGLEAYRRLLGRTYRAIRQVTGCRVVVDSSKSPAYGRILAGAPGVRVHVVHLVRDSRGVAFSLEKRKRRPGTPRPEALLDRRSAGVGSLLWAAANLLAESLGRRTGAYVRVRYGDFVDAPDAEVRRIARLLGEPRDPRPPEPLEQGILPPEIHHVLAGNPVREEGEIELHEDLEWCRSMPRMKRWMVSGLTLPLLVRYGFSLSGRRGVSTG